jgi:hypothetical protein
MNSDRRRFVAALGASCASQLLLPVAAQSGPFVSEKDGSPDPDAAESWIQRADVLGAVSGGLRLGKFPDQMYFITEKIRWTPSAGQSSYQDVTVPKGFVTDLTSIPRIFWTALRPDGTYTYAAIIHDFLYWEQARPRKEVDEIFKLAMQDFKVDASVIDIIYLAVSRFGGAAWNKNRMLREAGEKRILQDWPEDPTITWREWKTRDVF